MRYEVKTYNEKDDIWYCQTFATKHEAITRAKTLRENGSTVKGPMPVKTS